MCHYITKLACHIEPIHDKYKGQIRNLPSAKRWLGQVGQMFCTGQIAWDRFTFWTDDAGSGGPVLPASGSRAPDR